jgi:exonuclease SbcD
VELAGGRVTATRDIATPRTRRLLRIPPDGPAPLDDVLAALRALPVRGGIAEDERPLLEVRPSLERPEPTLLSRLHEVLEGKAARLIKWTPAYTGGGAALGDAAPGAALDDLDPVDVFRRRWSSRFPGDPPAALLAAFDDLLAEARGETAAVGPEVQP